MASIQAVMTDQVKLANHIIDLNVQTSGVRDSILSQLQCRKKIEQKPYEDICSLASNLYDRIYTLENENHKFKSDLQSLERTILVGGTEAAKFSRLSDLSSTLPSSQLEKKVCELESNLATALKEKDESVQTNIVLKNKLNEKVIQVSQLNVLLEEKTKEIAALKKALDNLKDENIALSIGNKSLEKQNQKLKYDSDAICLQIMALKREDADRLNAENEKERMDRTRREIAADVAEMSRIQAAKLAAGDPLATAIARMEDFEEVERQANKVSHVPTKVAFTYEPHDGETCALYWFTLDDTQTLATGGGCDRKVRIWRIKEEESEAVFTLHGSNAGINCIDVEAEMILAASNDMATRVWSLSDRKMRVTLTGHSNKVMAAKFIGQPSKAASCSTDRTVKIWDTNTATCVRTYFAGSSCHDLVYLQNQVITGHFDGVIRCWDLRRNQYHEASSMIKLQSKITSLDISNDSSKLICSLRDNVIKSVDLRKMEVLQVYSDEKFRISSDTCKAKFSTDGKYIACGSSDGNLFVWDVNSTKTDKILAGPGSALMACCWSPDGKRIASIEKGRRLAIWA